MSPALDPRLVRLPVSALATLSRRCSTLGTPGIGALREAGERTGSELFARLSDTPEQLVSSVFWLAVDDALRRLGLGRVAFHPLTRDLAAVEWHGSPEARGPRSDPGTPCCHFAAGVLAGLLEPAAGRTVGVVEARCRSAGSEPCWFLLGAPERVEAIATDQASARPLHEVLAPE